MREEDKLLLLAEIIGVDTSKYVTKYIEELRSSNVFLELCKNVHRARNVDSYKAQLLIDEFETIDFNSVKTLKECFILRARINYLLTTSLESNYINPFFYNEESDLIEKVGEIVVNFDGNEVTYTPDKFINITHGYAISVHKSQGGEFKMVVMPVVNSFKRMLYNKLVYTAVTRAKKTLILVGDRQSFLYGVKNDYVENRRTTLKEFLIDKYN